MSEIVDPIVVTPKKELQTPEFFKKDIEKISGEVFDKKIVDVPSGTKLYRHIISNELYFIATEKKPYSVGSKITYLDALNAVYVVRGTWYRVRSWDYNYGTSKIDIIYEKVVSTDGITYESASVTISDTVTEL